MSQRDRNASSTRRLSGRAHRLDRMIAPIVKPTLKKFGFQEFHLFEHWQQIVGVDLARDCVPIKFLRARGRNQGGTLVIRVESCRALEIQHSIPQIIERINGYLGGDAVMRLRLVQGPVSPADMPRKPVPTPLKATQINDIDEATKHIENSGLQQALKNLGERVSETTGPRRRLR